MPIEWTWARSFVVVPLEAHWEVALCLGSGGTSGPGTQGLGEPAFRTIAATLRPWASAADGP